MGKWYLNLFTYIRYFSIIYTMKALLTWLLWHNQSTLVSILLSTSQFTQVINASSYHAPSISSLMLFSLLCVSKETPHSIHLGTEHFLLCPISKNPKGSTQISKDADFPPILTKVSATERQFSHPGGKYCHRVDSCSQCQNKQVQVLLMQQTWKRQHRIEFHTQIHISQSESKKWTFRVSNRMHS